MVTKKTGCSDYTFENVLIVGEIFSTFLFIFKNPQG
jgi:hypothetical protein